VRVLIGSTEKMGTGMNAQKSLIALHHLDAPWRPADIEQRDGRILRQGNDYREVLIFNYITEGSFDAFIWQTLESKARFISQIMAGEITARTAEDVGDTVLTMAEVKALASGNPKVMHKVALETELTRLSHLYAAWRGGQSSMRLELTSMPERIPSAARTIDSHVRAKVQRDAYAEQPFAIALRETLDASETVTLDKRESAGKRLRLLAEMGYHKARHASEATMQSYRFFDVGVYKGFRLVLKSFANDALAPELWLILGDDNSTAYAASIGDSDLGVIQSLDAQLRNIDKKLQDAELAQRLLEEKERTLRVELEKPWEQVERYGRLKRQLAILNVELQQAGVDLGSSTALPDFGTVEQHEISPRRESQQAVDTSKVELNFSLDEILSWLREMHSGLPSQNVEAVVEPVVVSMPEPVTQTPVIDEAIIDAMEHEIEEKQAQLVFGQLVLETTKKHRKITVVPPKAQMGFEW